jgi:hypothetical protein
LKAQNPRILYWDIETSLQLAAIFQLANNDWIDPASLVTERYIICASWQWEGDKKIHAVSVLDDPKRYASDPHDDTHVVSVLHKVLSEADVLVHHNGDSFDKKYVETRSLVNGFPVLPPITTIDTYKLAKSRFMFNSNKLDYIGKMLKVGRKKPTSPGLWMRVLKGDRKAIKEMVEYNKHDVILLRDVFMKLRPYAPNHLNRELFGNEGCPRCGSTKVQYRGYHRAITKVYRRLQCQSCSGWFRLLKGEPGSTKHRVI